ncbi:MAG: hypothetical protein ACRDOK_00240 [Streptosporangiaceae bacterium]
MAGPAACPTCSGGKLAGWVNVPASGSRGRAGVQAAQQSQVQPEPQSAAAKALLEKIAASLQYGDTTPLVFGFELADLPAGWQPTAVTLDARRPCCATSTSRTSTGRACARTTSTGCSPTHPRPEHPGSGAPLPGGDRFGGLLTVFGSVRLLGPDPAAWTTDPLG